MKLLIFDVDGVLEREELIVKARYKAQIKAISTKLNVSQKEAQKKLYNLKKSIVGKETSSVYVLMKLGFSRAEAFNLIDSVDPKGLISTNKNCVKMLESVHKNNRIVTFSNTPRKSSEKTLKILKIRKYVNKTYSSEDFNESKPSTKILRKIKKDNGFKSKDTVVIGNSMIKDIIPAKKVGITTILFDQYHKYKKTNIPDFIINDLIEIIPLLEQNI